MPKGIRTAFYGQQKAGQLSHSDHVLFRGYRVGSLKPALSIRKTDANELSVVH